MTPPIVLLIEAIREIYRQVAAGKPYDEDIAEILAVTAALPPPVAASPDPASRGALAWLPTASDGRLGRICMLAREAAGAMPWHYSYPTGDGLNGRIAFADVVGPSGPCVSHRLRLGLTLVAPQTLYPMHAHPARELYCVVSGRALWTAGSVLRRPGPGGFVLHPSQLPHAMQTEAEALLAIYSWRGDIVTPPYYTDP